MNFIYTILIFLSLSLSAFGISTQITNEGWWCFFVGASTVTGLATIVITLAMVFQNMYFRNEIIRYSNTIRRDSKDIIRLQHDLDRYKKEFEMTLTEMYPKYEKDIFSNMSKTDAMNLEMILVKYPELKFDGVLNAYIDGIKLRLRDVSNIESNINDTIRRINDINDSNWMLKRVELPTDIKVLQ